MPYISQEKKQIIVSELKPILERWKVKASFSIRNYSTLVMKIYSSPIDFISNYNITTKNLNIPYFKPAVDYISVNTFHYKKHFSDDAKEFLSEVIPILNKFNGTLVEDSDYGTVPLYYVDVYIGEYGKPYQLISKDEAMKKTRYSGDPYWLTAKFGNCSECHKPIKGLRAFYYPNTKDIFCEECGEKHSADFQAHKQDEEFYNQQYQWGK